MGTSELSKPEQLRNRTKAFAIRIIRLTQSLGRNTESYVLGKQVLRSGTSVAANYRAVCRARSKREFTSKLGIVVEEADETVFWLELLADSDIVNQEKLKDLLQEARELTTLFAAAHQTAVKSLGGRGAE